MVLVSIGLDAVTAYTHGQVFSDFFEEIWRHFSDSGSFHGWTNPKQGHIPVPVTTAFRQSGSKAKNRTARPFLVFVVTRRPWFTCNFFILGWGQMSLFLPMYSWKLLCLKYLRFLWYHFQMWKFYPCIYTMSHPCGIIRKSFIREKLFCSFTKFFYPQKFSAIQYVYVCTKFTL